MSANSQSLNAKQAIHVSVPGSIMLMGEHAVLFGEMAIACAVDKYIHVTLTPAEDDRVEVDSALAQYHSSLTELADEPKLSFVIEAIRHVVPKLTHGFTLTIRSEFSHTVGLGSSAAVTAGTVAVLSAYAGLSVESADMFDRALAVVHAVQDGRGSGTDLVASIYGGLVGYRVKPREIQALTQTSTSHLNTTADEIALPDISLFYAGYKTKTPDVLKIVETKANNHPEIYADIYRLMGKTTEQAAQAITKKDWQKLAELMNVYQGLMDALGVSDHALSDMIYRLRGFEKVLSAKISGSGLGDCVVALGAVSAQDIAAIAEDYEHIPVSISGLPMQVRHAEPDQGTLGCFVAGTLIKTDQGMKPIQDINVGDRVLSKPEDGTGEPTYKPVLNTFVHEEKPIWMVRAEKINQFFDKSGIRVPYKVHDKASSSVEFLATPNHLVWVVGICNQHNSSKVTFYDQPHWKRVDELQQHEVAINAEGIMYHMTFVQPLYRFANPAAADLSDNPDYYWYAANYGKDYQQDYVHGDVRPDPDVTEEEYRGMGRIHDIAQYHEKGRHGTYVKDMSGNVGLINKLRTSDGEFIPYTTRVYNFEVADNHTYFINYAKLLVHQ